MNNNATQISLTIHYGVTDEQNGIEESDEFSYDFDKVPTDNEGVEAWGRCTDYDYETLSTRDDVSFYFFASSTNNESLDCDHEW